MSQRFDSNPLGGSTFAWGGSLIPAGLMASGNTAMVDAENFDYGTFPGEGASPDPAVTSTLDR